MEWWAVWFRKRLHWVMLHLIACDGHKLNILAEGVNGAVLFCFDETPRPNSFSFNICSGANRPIIK